MKWFRLASQDGAVKASEARLNDQFTLLEQKKDEIRRLRGLIGQSCDDCKHSQYCKNTDTYIYNESWILGCKTWEESKPKQSDEISQYIGDVDSILRIE